MALDLHPCDACPPPRPLAAAPVPRSQLLTITKFPGGGLETGFNCLAADLNPYEARLPPRAALDPGGLGGALRRSPRAEHGCLASDGGHGAGANDARRGQQCVIATEGSRDGHDSRQWRA